MVNCSSISSTRHQSIISVDLADQMPFAKATNGRVARHDTDLCRVMADKRHTCPAPCSRCRRFRSCMTAANHDDVK